MKQIQKKLLPILLTIILLIAGGCAGDNDEFAQELTLDDLPVYVTDFLNKFLPGQTPVKITIAEGSAENTAHRGASYIADMGNGIEIGFTENGYWQSVFSANNYPLPASFMGLLKPAVHQTNFCKICCIA